jgi:hypothetical protein
MIKISTWGEAVRSCPVSDPPYTKQITPACRGHGGLRRGSGGGQEGVMMLSTYGEAVRSCPVSDPP